MKGCEAMVIVGLVESCSAVISNELSNHCGGDIRISTKSEEGQVIVSVLEPSANLKVIIWDSFVG